MRDENVPPMAGSPGPAPPVPSCCDAVRFELTADLVLT